MTTSSAELRQRLTELEQRIEARSRELAECGVFKDVHEEFVRRLRVRQQALERRVDAAIQSGDDWRVVGAELERDFDGVHGEFARWLERADAESMKRRDT